MSDKYGLGARRVKGVVIVIRKCVWAIGVRLEETA